MRRTLKIVLSTAVCLAFAQACHADDTQPAQKQPQTKLEAFLGAKGTLIVRDISDIGSIDGIDVQAITAYKPGHEDDKTRGFIMSLANSVSSVTCYVDYDEAKSLSQAITYMQGLSEKWRGQTNGYREASYITTGGLKVTFYHTADGKHQDAKVYLTDGISLYTDMKDTEFAQFKSITDQAVVWLDKQ